MTRVNENYYKLKAGYLFPEIARRVNQFVESNPDKANSLIRCGIGDVTEPVPQAARDAMKKAVDDLGARDSFHGYGPEQGYEFLRHAIAQNEYRDREIEIADDEIFVSDGSKCDTGNILDIFGPGNRIAITDPVYPVYVDTNVMNGATGEANEQGQYEGLVYLPCNPDNLFVPRIPSEKVDLIYLCYPNNPTGATPTVEGLTQWVDYARKNRAIILYDAAYEAFISHPDVPHSIYEIPGADECAIEFRSFSKNGGFTGVRCGFVTLPKKVMGYTASGEARPLHALWSRRTSTKFNGASYIVQRGAEALYSEEGKRQVRDLVEYYLGNAVLLKDGCEKNGLNVFGGDNAPYLWVECPHGIDSWGMFDKMLNDASVVITPGSGFGAAGEGFFRISAFNSRENAETVADRIEAMKW